MQITAKKAKLTLDYKNVNFHMSEDSESFSMADYFDRNYDRTWLFYKFTISNAEEGKLRLSPWCRETRDETNANYSQKD